MQLEHNNTTHIMSIETVTPIAALRQVMVDHQMKRITLPLETLGMVVNAANAGWPDKAVAWREFNGTRSEHVSSLTGFMMILVYRKDRFSEAFDCDVSFANTVCADGWHLGRNEQFTHWAPVSFPE